MCGHIRMSLCLEGRVGVWAETGGWETESGAGTGVHVRKDEDQN